MPTETKNIDGIRWLRGIAAMMVVLHHTLELLSRQSGRPQPFGFGQYGVDIFFVISGFIIYLSVANSRDEARDFVIKRIIRVVPLYWLCTLLIAAVSVFAPALLNSAHATLATVLKSMLFIPHFNTAFPTQIWPLLVPGWSLNFEAFFYALMTLALIIDRRRIVQLLTGAILCCLCLRLMFTSSSAAFLTYTHPIMLEFLGGVYIAAAYVKGAFESLKRLTWLLPLGLVGLMVYPALYDTTAGLPPIVPSLAVVAGALILDVSKNFRRSKIGLMIGDASYSIYLSHLFVLGGLRKVFFGGSAAAGLSPTGYVLFLGGALATAALVGIGIYHWVEKPLLDALRGLVRKRKSSSPAVPSGSVGVASLREKMRRAH